MNKLMLIQSIGFSFYFCSLEQTSKLRSATSTLKTCVTSRFNIPNVISATLIKYSIYDDAQILNAY